LHGAERKPRSRGALVRDFVMGESQPQSYANWIASNAHEYSGFHLFAGEAGGELVYVTPETHRVAEDGIHAVSNAPAGESWPKVTAAAEEMKLALRMPDPESVILVLMQFLEQSRGTESVQSEVFLKGERYGTRASTVVVATGTEILFGEQSFMRGGEKYGKNRLFRVMR
ncbi:MAG: NRDE family protein, partial [Acidobacteriota bacterium]|nr:NRDE family protein [Acidobacteriota bacterium]